MRRIIRFALFGAIGYGAGGVLHFFVLRSLLPYGVGVWAVGVQVLFVVTGLLGGAALGVALRKGVRGIIILGLRSGIGFLFGNFLGGQLISLMLPEDLSASTNLVFVAVVHGVLKGAFGGMVLGLYLRGWRKTVGLSLAGALGFGTGSLIVQTSSRWPGLSFDMLIFLGLIGPALMGIIGGALLGTAVGYFEKE